jgi:hypothetical protein
MESGTLKRTLWVWLTMWLVFHGWTSSARAQDVTFDKVYYAAPTLKTEPAVSLRISETQIGITGKKPKEFGSLAISFATIDSMTYEFATRHRIAEGGRTMLLSTSLGLILMATKTTSHWLDIHYHDDSGAHTATLQLDKTEYESILSTLKARTGKPIAETSAATSDVNPTAESSDTDDVVPYPMEALIAAVKPAMADVGCKVTVEKPDRIECKRPRGGAEINGPGGEKVVATFQAAGDKTKVHIETDRGFNSHMAKKNWSSPIFKGMMGRVEPTAVPPPSDHL